MTTPGPGENTLKIKPDLAAIVTAASLMAAMLIWVIRLEGKVKMNADSIAARDLALDKLQQIRWDSVDQRLDALRRDLMLLQNRLLEREE